MVSQRKGKGDPLKPERHRCARVEVSVIHSRVRRSAMNITMYGLDLAKRVFQVHWVEPDTGQIKRKVLARSEVAGFFARQPWSLAARPTTGAGCSAAWVMRYG